MHAQTLEQSAIPRPLSMHLNLVHGKARETAQEILSKATPEEWKLVVQLAFQVVLLEESRRSEVEYWFHPRVRE